MRTLPLMLLAASLMTPTARAQAQNDAAPTTTIPSLPRSSAPTAPETQGPELDVFRDPPSGQAPATQVPVIQIPPPVIAPPVTTQSPPPATRAEPSRTPTPRDTPAAKRRVPQPETEPEPAAPPSQAPIEAAPQNRATAEPEPAPQPEPAPAPAAIEPTETHGISWPWIVGGLLLLLALAAAAMRRRRNRDTLRLPAPVEADETAASAPEPTAAPKPVPSPPAPPPPSPAAAPSTPATGRPHLAPGLDVSGARLSLMGATVTYVLSLTNTGDTEARDILVRATIANASAPMDDLLKPFFAGEAGLPIHSVPMLSPGESVHLRSELRLDPDQIAPINAGERALLIPLLAFDVRYGWGSEDAGAQGRTGRAFIVGQEQEPPTERLSPFRLDLGPRQFRRPAARATALTLDA